MRPGATFEIANTCNLNEYSALIAVGGDGTMHEVANGLLMREDKKRVPFGCIPNGSGDDFCASLTILNVDRALDFIVKGDIIKLDI